jgi:hypothetical protein
MRFIFLDIQWNSDIGLLVKYALIHVTTDAGLASHFDSPNFIFYHTWSGEVLFVIHLLDSTLSSLFLRFSVSGMVGRQPSIVSDSADTIYIHCCLVAEQFFNAQNDQCGTVVSDLGQGCVFLHCILLCWGSIAIFWWGKLTWVQKELSLRINKKDGKSKWLNRC